MITNEEFIAAAFSKLPEDARPFVCSFTVDPANAGRAWAGQACIPGEPLCPPGGFIQTFGPEANNYIAISSFYPGPEYKRRKAQFAAMHMIMVDDIGTKIPADKLRLPLSALVETSPGNTQGWYFLDPPITEREHGENLIDAMIASGLTADATDPGMRGVTRYGRLPVGSNTKAKYGTPAPVCRMHTWQPERRYSSHHIMQAFGLVMKPPRRLQVISGTPPPNLPAIAKAMPEFLQAFDLVLKQGDDRLHIVCPWVASHTGQDTSGTAYFMPSPDNRWLGGFKCQHGHCQHRNIGDLLTWVEKATEIALKEAAHG